MAFSGGISLGLELFKNSFPLLVVLDDFVHRRVRRQVDIALGLFLAVTCDAVGVKERLDGAGELGGEGLFSDFGGAESFAGHEGYGNAEYG